MNIFQISLIGIFFFSITQIDAKQSELKRLLRAQKEKTITRKNNVRLNRLLAIKSAQIQRNRKRRANEKRCVGMQQEEYCLFLKDRR